MNAAEIIFWFLSALALLSGVMVILSKNPVYSVLWLISLFFAISGHYILLNAQFLAIVNIIVYAGAIMVLFLFVIMLMNLNTTQGIKKKVWAQFAGVISAGMLLWILLSVVKSSIDLKGRIAEINTGDIGLVENLGKVLFTQYAVPFEICSVLFLSAMVGAVVIGKKD
ncbi:MAG: NADH-quinone oxidoreductase subunit J [Pseudopedobacter saltans]|uniref:NADH-quinone oxidoreductase subunit J n=1 Tax=Pseudopedobacter saltans TaxID=151895 RepID=A0A2W5GE72_9SPHI|nr:MAG: NADH-quinone oxidoreductase subunit J [Pseudopedobacter saltans]